MKLSLKTKIWVLSIGIVTAFSIAALSSLALMINRETNKNIHQDSQTARLMLSQYFNERTDVLKSQTNLITRLPILQAAIQCLNTTPGEQGSKPAVPSNIAAYRATMADLAEDYRKQLNAAAVVITDRDGHSLSDTAKKINIGKDMQSELGIAKALKGEIWSGVTIWNAQIALVVSTPVKIGGFVWGTFSVYDVDSIHIAKELKGSLGSEIALIDHNVITAGPVGIGEKLNVRNSDPIVINFHNIKYFALYTPMPNTDASQGLGFVILKPYDTAMSAWYRIRLAFIGFFFFTTLLAALAGSKISKDITHPLEIVVNAARIMQEGKWPEKLNVTSSDEIGLLQQVFNEMSATLKSDQERLVALLDIDPLTEAANHRKFQERLSEEATRCSTSGEALTLLLMGIDGFQHFNQQFGHTIGDNALKTVSSIVDDNLPDVAFFARFSGDEFAVLLPGLNIAEGEAAAEQIRLAVLEQSEKIYQTQLTLSIGCAEFGVHSGQADGLSLAAEIALSLAKQLGRNRVCRFDSVPGIDQNADPYQLYKFFQDGSLATIQALAAAVDAKDTYTQGHSARVSLYAYELAGYIGLSPVEADHIKTVGTLHDVGKIGVPDAILKKAGPLSPEERTIMETHPALGEIIVGKVPQLASTLPGVRHHHERWDGKGYPDGLQAEFIPLIARILALADTFDAMTSDRPYRKGMSWSTAIGLIQQGKGSQFDPDLVEPFCMMMLEKMEQMDDAA